MFIFIVIYDYCTMSMDMAPDKVHRSMVILMAIEQFTPGTETIDQ